MVVHIQSCHCKLNVKQWSKDTSIVHKEDSGAVCAQSRGDEEPVLLPHIVHCAYRRQTLKWEPVLFLNTISIKLESMVYKGVTLKFTHIW